MIEVDTSEWTLDDWLKDEAAFSIDVEAMYEALTSTGAKQLRAAQYVIKEGVIPTKVGLLRSRCIQDWKKRGMHEAMISAKEEARSLTQEYKRVDAIRPYGKAGPLCTASVHPARVGLRPIDSGDFMYVGRNGGRRTAKPLRGGCRRARS